MTLAQIYLDTPEIEEATSQASYFDLSVAEKMKIVGKAADDSLKQQEELMNKYETSNSKKPRTDSPRKLLPKLKNMSRCKAWKGKI